MIASLRSIRLSRMQIALVAGLSGIATALIIATALGRSAAQSAAIAALRQRPVVVDAAYVPRPRAAAATGSSDPVSSSTRSSSVSSSSAPPASSPAPAASSAAGAPAGGGSTSPASTTTASTTTTSSSPKSATTKPKVKHVFVIALSTTSFEATFGQGSVARYLNGSLRRDGTLLGGYETLGRSALPDYLAMVSGQAPNADTRSQCSTYAEFPANTAPAANGQVPGAGCVYPNTITTIGDQVTAAGQVWKAYIEDMGKSTCVHPNSDALDDVPLPRAGPDYDTRHNPFIYFHSLLDLGGCASDDVSLDQLPSDLRSASKTPSYVFIAPRACDDAFVATCADGKPAGLAGEDAFLKDWVPRILGSAAYKRDGVLIITFALTGAGASGGPAPTGTLVLSPFARRSKTISTTYNPYSLLRTVEDLFGYAPLAHAKRASSFAAQVLPGA
jgi:phosphatidylinositol-3-phosphatase